jgi:hypothetical protein
MERIYGEESFHQIGEGSLRHIPLISKIEHPVHPVKMLFLGSSVLLYDETTKRPIPPADRRDHRETGGGPAVAPATCRR